MMMEDSISATNDIDSKFSYIWIISMYHQAYENLVLVESTLSTSRLSSHLNIFEFLPPFYSRFFEILHCK